MDEARSEAVTEAFVRLYKEGLIYRLVGVINLVQFILKIAKLLDIS